MKQVIQNLRTGVLELMDVPSPRVAAGQLLIATRASVISAGTERMLVEFGKASLLQKARQQPEKVKQVWDKIRADGLIPTLEAVFTKLDEPISLGYCNAGIVLEVGAGITEFSPGDRVASNAPHAEIALVPRNLSAKIPDNVTDDQACFAVLGAIALQGIRLLQPELGERVAVYGMGLIGLLTVQLLRAAGTAVLAIDPQPDRCRLAASFGATTVSSDQDVETSALHFSAGHGMDGVIIAASAQDDDIVNQGAQICRKRGRIVQVGVTQLQLSRKPFFEKELTFQVSCSYGPGRYDPRYEQQGHDYPLPYVRWTEQRNIAAVLELMRTGQLDVEPLITRRIPHHDSRLAYQLVSEDRGQLGVVLQYAEPTSTTRATHVSAPPLYHASERTDRVTVGFIGAGAFAKGVLIPQFCRTEARLECIASASGLTAAHAARKFGIRASSSDYRQILDDERINTVVITTRPYQHASMVVEALQAGKHVFVEKPLAIDANGLAAVQQAYADCAGRQQLLVGYNRRFAPLVKTAQDLLRHRTEPLCMVMQVNAGRIPPEHWVHDRQIGGGRMISEGCHWFDLLSFLANAPIITVKGMEITDPHVMTRQDHMTISFGCADGSLATLHYFANGNRAYPKEMLTVYSEGRVLELDNFRSLRGFGFSKFRRQRLFRQDKGHREEVRQFVQRVAQGGPPLIPIESLWRVTAATLEAEQDANRETNGVERLTIEAPMSEPAPDPAYTASVPT